MKKEIIESVYWNIPWLLHDEDYGLFDEFYSHEWDVFSKILNTFCDENEFICPDFSDSFKNAYIAGAQEITLRVLILEMNVCKECSELNGQNENEQYRDFKNRFLGDRCYIKEIYKLYPEMYTCLMEYILKQVNLVETILSRFYSDKVKLENLFFEGKDCGCIRRVLSSGGDKHCGGQSVCFIELSNGKQLVYKPRSIKMDSLFCDLLKKVSAGVGISYKTVNMLIRDNYGWCEWIQAKSCNSDEELRRYYFRNGILLCTSYLLGTSDLHYENLIANGEYPTAVDLEVGVGSKRNNTKRPQSDLENLYNESVLHTGLLPLYAWNENGEGINVSAISGGSEQLIPFSVPCIANIGRVDMRVEYRQPKSNRANNLATLNGKFIEPYMFIKDVESGFSQAYKFIIENKLLIKEWLQNLKDVRVRYLYRDTQQYAMMLAMSYVPSILESKSQRIELLNKICGDNKRIKNKNEERIVAQEINQLLYGDTPYFYYDPFECDLVDGIGERISSYFEVPVITNVMRRLERMGIEDLNRQLYIIRTSIGIGVKENELFQKRNLLNMDTLGELDSLDKLDLAEKIADYILENAIWTNDRSELGWVNITMAGYREKCFLLRPTNMYLYDGIAGVTLFFEKLSMKRGKYGYVAEKLKKMLFEYTDLLLRNKCNDLPTGAFVGETSVVYAYAILYKITKNINYLGYMKKHSNIVKTSLKRDKVYDVLGGNAGAVLVFLYAYEITNDEEYLILAKDAGDVLLEAAVDYPYGLGWKSPNLDIALTGMAHGVSGMMLAFSKLAYYYKDKRYELAAHGAYMYEQHYYRAEINDWADLRSKEHYDNQNASFVWCHGRGGILMSREVALLYDQGNYMEDMRKNIEQSITLLKANFETEDFCLCHGICGGVALMSLFDGREGDFIREKVLKMMWDKRDTFSELLSLQESESYGLMNGIAGIGYWCISTNDEILELLSLNPMI